VSVRVDRDSKWVLSAYSVRYSYNELHGVNEVGYSAMLTTATVWSDPSFFCSFASTVFAQLLLLKSHRCGSQASLIFDMKVQTYH
jgi:hypothetical protein